MFTMDAGVSRSLFEKRATIAVSVTVVFNTNTSRYEVKGLGVSSNNRNKIESRFLKLSFTWKFGNKNVKVNTNRKTGVEAESRRMGE